MPIIEDKKIIHHFIIEEDVGAPPAYQAQAQPGAHANDSIYRATITFGSDILSIHENFQPQRRGLSAPKLILGTRANDISEEIVRTWNDINITTTTVGHASANAGYDGLRVGLQTELARGALFLGNIGLHALGVKLPFLAPLAEPLSHMMHWLGHCAADHVYHIAGARGAASAVATGFSQTLSLIESREQDELIYGLIDVKRRLADTSKHIGRRLEDGGQALARLQMDHPALENQRYPVVALAYRELLSIYQETIASAEYANAVQNAA